MLDKFLKIILVVLILFALFIASMLCIEMIKSRPHIDLEEYPTIVDYGILSEEQIETFDNILYAVQNDEPVVDCPSYSEKERHEISTQLGLYFGDTESVWRLIYWHDNHATLNLSTFYELLNQKIIIDARIDEAVSTLIEGSDGYKLLQISNYIAAKITYTDGFRDIIAAFNGKGVCSTYSMLFYKMATRLGIQTYICYGYAGEGYHSWNVVELDGECRYFDITWYDDYVHNIRYIFKKSSWNRDFQINNKWSTDLDHAA